MYTDRTYLDKVLKEYYSQALLIEIENKSIDKGIEKYLLKISNSLNFRPLFSKRGTHHIKKN